MSLEIVVELLSGLSLIATAIFPTIREHFLSISTQLGKEARTMYLNTILQILIIMIYFSILQLLMLLYIYYIYNKSINLLYFGISCLVVISSLFSNIISLNIQISKYDFDVKLFNESSVNKALSGDYGIISFISRILSVIIFLIILSIVLGVVYFYSEKVRNITDNYFKKLTFQNFYGNTELKTKKINELF